MRGRLTEHLGGAGLVERQARQGGFVVPASSSHGKAERLLKLAGEHPGQLVFLGGRAGAAAVAGENYVIPEDGPCH